MSSSVATIPNETSARSWFARLELGSLALPFLLAVSMTWSVTRSLEVANWADGLTMLAVIGLAALFVGTLFARVGWMHPLLAHPLASLLGVVFVVQQISSIVEAQTTAEFGAAKAQRLTTWGDIATELAIRVIIWLRTLQAGGRGEDIALFVLTLALIIWGMGYVTGWLIFRHQRAWIAVALQAGIVLINYTYAWPKPTGLFFIFMTTALLLIACLHIDRNQRLWRSRRIEFPDFLSARVLLASLLFFVFLLIVTAFLPKQPDNEHLAHLWRTIRAPITALREEWQEAFSTINAPPGSAGTFLTRNARVGGPRQLGTALVMTVRSAEYSYWRAAAFDRYTGRMWQNMVGERARAALGVATAEAARTPLAPGVRFEQPELRGRVLVTTTIELAQTRTDGLIMVGGALASTGLPVLIQHGYLEISGELLPNFTETATVVTEAPLEASQTYTVATYLSTVDEQSLRESGIAYPEWVRLAYLQLPDTLPPRVRELAASIVRDAGAVTPYDKALAIQEYLRTLTYNDQRPVPPDDRDWVDWFLFDAPGGYCDDFTSAMVVLLRAEGVPARWVHGYAGGELDPDRRVYLVRENVAHSWPEVYFPGYGWQRFEPTPAPYASVPVRPAFPPADDVERPEITGGLGGALSDPEAMLREMIERNTGPAIGDDSALQREIEAQRAQERIRQATVVGGAVAFLGALVGALFLWLHWDVRRLSPAAAAYARLTRLAGWAGVSAPLDATPYEYAALLQERLPRQKHVINHIVSSFVTERYHPAHAAPASLPVEDWHALRRELLMLIIKRIGAAPRLISSVPVRAANVAAQRKETVVSDQYSSE
ncbi:transglutaminase domain-containing protein [Roseiflexus sp.]|uniref:transglutaminase family protein n=1 Tax=Roseiflexus sp. TaxID=2562120 RepID=UPI00398BB472